jgi:hypothetical protein
VDSNLTRPRRGWRWRRRSSRRTGTAAVALTVLSVGAGLVAAPPALAASPVLDNVVAGHSGRCLDVAGVSTADGAALVQWDCLGEAQTNQRFWLEPLPCPPGTTCTQYYKLRPRHTGKCIEVQGAGTAAGAVLVQAPCRGNAHHQDVSLRAVPYGYNLVLRHSGQCVDVAGGWVGNGVAVGQWPCLGGAQTNQAFTFTQSPRYDGTNVAFHSGKCLEVQGASMAAGAPVVQAPCVYDKPSQTTIFYNRGGYYVAPFRHSGMCFDIAGASYENGARLTQWPCNADALNQRFMVVPADINYNNFQIIAQHSGMCVEIQGAGTADGAAAVQSTCAAGLNQTNQWFSVRFQPRS